MFGSLFKAFRGSGLLKGKNVKVFKTTTAAFFQCCKSVGKQWCYVSLDLK